MSTGSWSGKKMEIKIKKNNDNIYLLKLSGSMDLLGSNQLKDLVLKMIENKAEHFVIDLSDVTGVNSDGIGALVYVSSTLKKLNCQLIMIVPEGPVLHALASIRLKHFFIIAPDLKEAIALVK